MAFFIPGCSIIDPGPAHETWTLMSFSHATGRLYMHTMKEIVCLEAR